MKYPLELVQADLSDRESWVEAVQGCTYVYHVASPFPGSSSDLTPEQQQERIIKPAVDGTLNVLQACADVGGVKRVVVTSSMGAVSSGLHGNPGKPKDYIYTEEDWSDESVCGPYVLSKTKAEKAAWEFVEKLEDNKKFELVVVNPAYVQGPLLSAASGTGTQLLIRDMLNGKIPAIPDINFCLVDVRDVVDLHKAAMEKPEAAGKRHLAVNTTVAYKEIAAIVKEEFGNQGYSIPSISLPKFGMWMFKFFNQGARDNYDLWGIKIFLSNERMKSLGVEPRPIKDTILDTCYSLIELGLAVKKPRYRGPAQATGGAEGDDQPAEAEEKPAETEGKLAKAEENPAEAEENPAEAEENPAEAEENPAEAEENPAEAEENPAEAEQNPAEAEENPAEAEENPAEAEENPAEAEENPAEAEQKPAEAEENPAEAEENPAEAEENPVEAEENPAEADENPAEAEENPAEEKPAEAEEKTTEVEE